MLGQCSSLAVLNLTRKRTGDKGAGRLAGALGQCSTLTALSVAVNGIGGEGFRSLAVVLEQFSSRNPVGEHGEHDVAMLQNSIGDTTQLILQ